MTSTVSTTGNSYLDSLMKSSSSSSSSTSTKSNQTIDQAGFLQLLTAQLKTQDPTDSDSNSTNQMVQQMATFSQVQGITEMNTSLGNISTNIAASRFGSAASLIGRAALVNSSIATQASNGAYAGQIAIPSDAKDVTITLTNSSGQTVYSKDLGTQSAGNVNWSWDGKDTGGNATTDGALQVNVTAVGTSGSALTTTSNTWNEINSVQSPSSGSTSLITGLGTIDPANVLQLS